MAGARTDGELVDEMIEDYLRAFNAGDYLRVASYWAEDGVHLPPIGPEIRGRTALGEFYRQSHDVMNARISDSSYECRFAGDHVFVRERWTVTLQPPGEEATSHPGRGLWVGRKEATESGGPSGRWRGSRDPIRPWSRRDPNQGRGVGWGDRWSDQRFLIIASSRVGG